MLVNGRISSRSYPRYRLARGFFRRVLADVDRFCMQSDESARRIIDIGADPGAGRRDRQPEVRVARVAGRRRRAAAPAACCATSGFPPSRPVFMAASTLKGEEAPVLAAFAAVRRAHPTALLIIAPRKPERFGEAEALARAEGLRVVRRTELAVDAEPRADVVILDTIGELAHLFQVATVVFVGGSLVDAGRPQHSRAGRARQADRVRPAHAELRGDRRRRSCRSQAAIQVDERRRSWPTVVVRLMGDPVERARLGAAARALVEANRGAKPRTLEAIADAPAAARPAAASCGRSSGRGRICFPQITAGEAGLAGREPRPDVPRSICGHGPAPARQRRQHRDGRARQDAASSRIVARLLVDGRRAAGHSEPRLRAAPSARTASSS